MLSVQEYDGRRAAVDPSRTVGLANFVAVNKSAPVGCTVVSEKELRSIEIVANSSPRRIQDEINAERARLHELSKKREALWPDTVHAHRNQVMKDRDIRLQAEEKRRQAIDAEEAALQEAQRQRTLIDATEQLAWRDERMMNAYRQLLLQQTLEERAEQVAYFKAKAESIQGLDKEEARKYREIALLDEAEKKMNSARMREKAIETKLTNMQQLEQQIVERRSHREQAKLEQSKLELMATAEALQTKLDAQAVKAKNRRAAEESIATSPYKSPRELLSQKRLEVTTDPEWVSAEAFVASKAEFDAKLREVEKAKFERRGKLIDAATGNYAKVLDAGSPRQLTAENITLARSIFDTMEEENLRREASHRKKPHDFSVIITPRRESDRKALRDEEGRMVDRFREYQTMEMRLDDEQAAEKRELERRHAQLLLMQAAQKKANELLAKEDEKKMSEHWQAAQEAEQTMFRQLIEHQLPPNMNPRLAQRALAPVSPRK